MTLVNDRRWLRFSGSSYKCACCNKEHPGLFDIVFDHPDVWLHGNLRASGKEFLVVGEDGLTSDLCSVGEHRFIRCLLPFPIVGTNRFFNFGVWSSLAEQNFARYVQCWERGDYSSLGDLFGWLSNRIPSLQHNEGYLPCTVTGFAKGMRPKLLVNEGQHPIAGLQRSGIEFEQLLDIYSANGIDVRSHLGE